MMDRTLFTDLEVHGNKRLPIVQCRRCGERMLLQWPWCWLGDERSLMKSGAQKTLKVISVITIIIAILVMAFAVLLIIAGGIVGANLENAEVAASLNSSEFQESGLSAEQTVALTAGFGIFGGIFVLIDGLLSLIVGILGIRGSNDPRKIGPFRVFAIIGFIFSLIYIFILCFGAGTWENWIAAGANVVVTGICVWLAMKIRSQVVTM